LTAEVVVASHGTARWNTSDGKRPATVKTSADVTQQGYFI
jgi:hypothetical protein